MLNYIWLGLVLAAVLLGGATDHLKEVNQEAFAAARSAVMGIALPLIGITALWLGVMRLAEKSGMIQVLARALRPVMRRLFPDVPEDHPAMGSMLMNFAANMIGLTNAATPLGLRAMTDLERLNPRPGTATNAMCTFLAINTSSLQLLPTTAIGILAAAGSTQPTAIVGTALLATFCSMMVGITSVKLLQRLPWFRLAPLSTSPAAADASAPTRVETQPPPGAAREATLVSGPWSRWAAPSCLVLTGFFGLLFCAAVFGSGSGVAPVFIRCMDALSVLAIPFLLALFPLYAALRGVRVYEEFVEGAKDGFHVAVRIMPYLVAMLVAVGMFRGAGGVDLVARALRPLLDWLKFPAELLPMVITRPLSGSATIGLLGDLARTFGGDHLITRTGATILGSTETTLYVVAVYFGAVAVKRTRHAVAAGLLADLAGVTASVLVCRLVFAR